MSSLYNAGGVEFKASCVLHKCSTNWAHPQSPTHPFKQSLKMYFCLVVLGIKPRASSMLNMSFTTELWAQLKTTIWWLPTVEHLSGGPLLNIAICLPTDDAWMVPRIRILVIHLVEIWWALTRDCSPVLTEGPMKTSHFHTWCVRNFPPLLWATTWQKQ